MSVDLICIGIDIDTLYRYVSLLAKKCDRYITSALTLIFVHIAHSLKVAPRRCVRFAVLLLLLPIFQNETMYGLNRRVESCTLHMAVLLNADSGP